MLIKDATKVTKDLLSHLQDPEFNDIKIRGGGAVQQDYPPYESKGSTPFAQYYDQKEYSFSPERSCQTDRNEYLLLLLLYFETKGSTPFAQYYQIYQPGGLLIDDTGNLLLCNSGNRRLLVLSEKMEFIKVRLLIIPLNCSVLDTLLSAGDEHVLPAATPQHVEAEEVRVRGLPGPGPGGGRQVQAQRGRPAERGDHPNLQ